MPNVLFDAHKGGDDTPLHGHQREESAFNV